LGAEVAPAVEVVEADLPEAQAIAEKYAAANRE